MEKQPQKGDIVYLDTTLDLSHGEDDMIWGTARITEVNEIYGGLFITVEAWPDENHNWRDLAPLQDKLRATFGDSWAERRPDDRAEFNDAIF